MREWGGFGRESKPIKMSGMSQDGFIFLEGFVFGHATVIPMKRGNVLVHFNSE